VLMKEIRDKSVSGGLRHVTEEEKNRPPAETGRDALLKQIRDGVHLKKVDVDALSSGAASSNSNGDGGDIACLLQRALRERNNAVCQSSTDDDDSDYDDDDWDD